MKYSLTSRLVVAGVLCLLVVGALSLYEAEEDRHSRYPTIEELRDGYAEHVGQRIHYWSTVREVDENSFEAPYYDVPFVVRGSVDGLDAGDTVQVYGTIRPAQTVDPERIVVSESSGRVYMFLISGVAVVLTLSEFFARWRPNRREGFVPASKGDP